MGTPMNDMFAESNHFAKCGRRTCTKEEFMRQMGITEDDVKSPELIEKEHEHMREKRATERKLLQEQVPGLREKATMSADELRELGNKAFTNGEYEEAIRCYTEVLKEEPTNHIMLSSRSAAILRGGFGPEYDQLALADADQCIALKPNWFKGYGRRGDVLMHMGLIEEAMEAFEIGLSMSTNNKSLKKSLSECRKLCGLEPDDGGRLSKLMKEYHQEAHRSGAQSAQQYLASELREYRRQARQATPNCYDSGISSIDTTAYNSFNSSATSTASASNPYHLTSADIARPVHR